MPALILDWWILFLIRLECHNPLIGAVTGADPWGGGEPFRSLQSLWIVHIFTNKLSRLWYREFTSYPQNNEMSKYIIISPVDNPIDTAEYQKKMESNVQSADLSITEVFLKSLFWSPEKHNPIGWASNLHSCCKYWNLGVFLNYLLEYIELRITLCRAGARKSCAICVVPEFGILILYLIIYPLFGYPIFYEHIVQTLIVCSVL